MLISNPMSDQSLGNFQLRDKPESREIHWVLIVMLYSETGLKKLVTISYREIEMTNEKKANTDKSSEYRQIRSWR